VQGLAGSCSPCLTMKLNQKPVSFPRPIPRPAFAVSSHDIQTMFPSCQVSRRLPGPTPFPPSSNSTNVFYSVFLPCQFVPGSLESVLDPLALRQGEVHPTSWIPSLGAIAELNDLGAGTPQYLTAPCQTSVHRDRKSGDCYHITTLCTVGCYGLGQATQSPPY
jgi:hypothetical protein